MLTIGSREEYHEKIQGRILGKEDCPFCGSNKDENLCIWESEHWQIFHNKYPYTGTLQHIMAVPRIHKTLATELTAEEFADLADVYVFVSEFFGDDQYFSCTRETMAKRSVEHYHIHFMPGILKGKYLRNMLMHQDFPIHQELD